MPRPDWDRYYLMMAHIASLRGTCVRLQVGTVLVDADNRIVSLGYNGAPSGLPQCDEIGCLMIEGHCKRSLHAEANAFAAARGHGRGSTVYNYGASPCYPDALLMIAHGVKRLVWSSWKEEPYDAAALKFLKEAGVEVTFAHALDAYSITREESL